MARPATAVAALLLLALPALVGGQGSAPITQTASFSAIQSCVPFVVLVDPSPAAGPAYGFQLGAEPAVAAAVRATVAGDTLQLESGGFATQQPIQASKAHLLVVWLARRSLCDSRCGWPRVIPGTESARPTSRRLQAVVYLPPDRLASLSQLGPSTLYVGEGKRTRWL